MEQFQKMEEAVRREHEIAAAVYELLKSEDATIFESRKVLREVEKMIDGLELRQKLI